MRAQDTHTDHTGAGANRPANGGLTIRRLDEHDRRSLEHLAALDSAAPPVGEWLGAEVEGQLLAAASLDGNRTIADPFSRTAELTALLELRTSQLRRRAPAPRVSHRRFRQPAPLAGPSSGSGRLLTQPLRPY